MIAYSNDGANFKEYEENGKVKVRISIVLTDWDI